MKIAVIGASGKSGSVITKEALARGHKVTGIVRDASKDVPAQAQKMTKDILALTYDDLKDYDTIVDAFGVWAEKDLPQHKTSLMHLADVLSGKPNRLLVVGGAGGLYVDPQHTTRVMDTPDFPDAFKPLAINMCAAFNELKTRNDVNWTYISPSANFDAEGARTGKYRAGGEELLVNSAGQSEISYADYAIAMVDEIENGEHIKERFSVVGG